MKSMSAKTSIKVSRLSKKRWTPHAYQVRGVEHLVQRGSAALFMDPGLGKTSISLTAFKALMKSGVGRRCLVVAPLRVATEVWAGEVEKWADFEGLRVEVLHGPKKDEALERDADIYTINPEGLGWLLSSRRFAKLHPDTLIVDESTKFKNTRSLRFKLLKMILGKFRRRWILTGTPAPNGLEDLFGQIYILDQGKALGSFITHFRNQYFVPSVVCKVAGKDGKSHTVNDWVPAEGAEEKISEAIAPYVLRLSAADYLKLPKLVKNVVPVTLPPPARKIYETLQEEMFAELADGGLAVAMSKASATTKCRQVANGGLYKQFDADDNPVLKKGEWSKVHDAKTEALMDIVEELQGSPVLVAYEFAHDLARLKEALGKDTPCICGGLPDKRLHELVVAWNAGEIPVLLAQPMAMSHGLNMQDRCRHIIIHSLTWDLEVHDQFIKRVWRQGNDAPSVFLHYLIAKNTIDEVILETLGQKDHDQAALMACVQKYRERLGK